MTAFDAQASRALSLSASTPMSVSASVARRRSLERRFYVGMALGMTLAVFAGFARSFYLKPTLFPDYPAPPEGIFVLHGFIFSGWMLLFVAQTWLVTAGRVAWHRTLGALGTVLAALMLPMGIYVSLVAAHRPGGFIGIPIPALQFLIVPLASIALFASFITTAIVRRGDPQAHKRLVLLGTLQLVTPGIARWPGLAPFGPPAFFGITDLFLVVLAVFDRRTRGRLHPVTRWGGLLSILAQPAQLAFSGTDAWLRIAHWAVGLLG